MAIKYDPLPDSYVPIQESGEYFLTAKVIDNTSKTTIQSTSVCVVCSRSLADRNSYGPSQLTNLSSINNDGTINYTNSSENLLFTKVGSDNNVIWNTGILQPSKIYDYSSGCSMQGIISTFADIYINYETALYADVYNLFFVQIVFKDTDNKTYTKFYRITNYIRFKSSTTGGDVNYVFNIDENYNLTVECENFASATASKSVISCSNRLECNISADTTLGELQSLVITRPKRTTYYQGEILHLQYTYGPGADISFDSSDEQIAEVDNDGKVTCKNAGTVKITATATISNGKTASDTIILKIVESSNYSNSNIDKQSDLKNIQLTVASESADNKLLKCLSENSVDVAENVKNNNLISDPIKQNIHIQYCVYNEVTNSYISTEDGDYFDKLYIKLGTFNKQFLLQNFKDGQYNFTVDTLYINTNTLPMKVYQEKDENIKIDLGSAEIKFSDKSWVVGDITTENKKYTINSLTAINEDKVQKELNILLVFNQLEIKRGNIKTVEIKRVEINNNYSNLAVVSNANIEAEKELGHFICNEKEILSSSSTIESPIFTNTNVICYSFSNINNKADKTNYNIEYSYTTSDGDIIVLQGGDSNTGYFQKQVDIIKLNEDVEIEKYYESKIGKAVFKVSDLTYITEAAKIQNLWENKLSGNNEPLILYYSKPNYTYKEYNIPGETDIYEYITTASDELKDTYFTFTYTYEHTYTEDEINSMSYSCVEFNNYKLYNCSESTIIYEPVYEKIPKYTSPTNDLSNEYIWWHEKFEYQTKYTKANTKFSVLEASQLLEEIVEKNLDNIFCDSSYNHITNEYFETHSSIDDIYICESSYISTDKVEDNIYVYKYEKYNPKKGKDGKDVEQAFEYTYSYKDTQINEGTAEHIEESDTQYGNSLNDLLSSKYVTSKFTLLKPELSIAFTIVPKQKAAFTQVVKYSTKANAYIYYPINLGINPNKYNYYTESFVPATGEFNNYTEYYRFSRYTPIRFSDQSDIDAINETVYNSEVSVNYVKYNIEPNKVEKNGKYYYYSNGSFKQIFSNTTIDDVTVFYIKRIVNPTAVAKAKLSKDVTYYLKRDTYIKIQNYFEAQSLSKNETVYVKSFIKASDVSKASSLYVDINELNLEYRFDPKQAEYSIADRYVEVDTATGLFKSNNVISFNYIFRQQVFKDISSDKFITIPGTKYYTKPRLINFTGVSSIQEISDKTPDEGGYTYNFNDCKLYKKVVSSYELVSTKTENINNQAGVTDFFIETKYFYPELCYSSGVETAQNGDIFTKVYTFDALKNITAQKIFLVENIINNTIYTYNSIAVVKKNEYKRLSYIDDDVKSNLYGSGNNIIYYIDNNNIKYSFVKFDLNMGVNPFISTNFTYSNMSYYYYRINGTYTKYSSLFDENDGLMFAVNKEYPDVVTVDDLWKNTEAASKIYFRIPKYNSIDLSDIDLTKSYDFYVKTSSVEIGKTKFKYNTDRGIAYYLNEPYGTSSSVAYISDYNLIQVEQKTVVYPGAYFYVNDTYTTAQISYEANVTTTELVNNIPLALGNESAYTDTGKYTFHEAEIHNYLGYTETTGYINIPRFAEAYWTKEYEKEIIPLQVASYTFGTNSITSTYNYASNSYVVSTILPHKEITYNSKYIKTIESYIYKYYDNLGNLNQYTGTIYDENGKYYGLVGNEKVQLVKLLFIDNSSYTGSYLYQSEWDEVSYIAYTASSPIVNGQNAKLYSSTLHPAKYIDIVEWNDELGKYQTKSVLETAAYYSYEYYFEKDPFITSSYLYHQNALEISNIEDLSNALSYTYLSLGTYIGVLTYSMNDLTTRLSTYITNYIEKSYDYSNKLNSTLYTAYAYIGKSLIISANKIVNGIGDNTDKSIAAGKANTYTLSTALESHSYSLSNSLSEFSYQTEKNTTNLSDTLVSQIGYAVDTFHSDIFAKPVYRHSPSTTYQVTYEQPEYHSGRAAVVNVNKYGITYTSYEPYAYYTYSYPEYEDYTTEHIIKSTEDFEDTTLSTIVDRGLVHTYVHTERWTDKNNITYETQAYSYVGIADLLSDLHISTRIPTKQEFLCDVSTRLFVNNTVFHDVYSKYSPTTVAKQSIMRANALWVELHKNKIV